ncbi:MAG: hypothetical protein J6A15_06410 [Clostridia bacterium]|nr:hypothetical protein [Clostridia bacterium]
MIGYIYKTTNNINGKVYIGKKESSMYIDSYYGSGKIIKRAIKKYGIDNFTNEIIYKSNTIDDLNANEKRLISEYKEKYGSNCYNIAAGGDGGNVFRYADQKTKDNFSKKMEIINKQRCSSDSFKEKISIANKMRYSNEDIRREHSEKIKKAWSSDVLRAKQSEILIEVNKRDEVRANKSKAMREVWTRDGHREQISKKAKEVWSEDKRSEHSKILKSSYTKERKLKDSERMKSKWLDENYKKNVSNSIKQAYIENGCINRGSESVMVCYRLIHNNIDITFKSRKELEKYLKDKYDICMSKKTFKSIVDGGIPFKSYYKKHICADGLIIYRLGRSVETMGDECNPVGVEE